MTPSTNAKRSRKEAKLVQPPENWNYETTVAKVEEIIEQIESGQLDLAEVFDQFTAATQYLRQCETFLAQRQEQIDLLIETLTDETEPF